jgi:hypothetical protein
MALLVFSSFNLRLTPRPSGKFAIAVMLACAVGRAALAAEDPFAELRKAHVDRILIADSGMNPTAGEGVIWIRDPSVIRGLLAPIQPRKGGSFLCGYHYDLQFFSGERLVRMHRLNTECRDYVVEERTRSFQFEGQLAARWQPYVDRMSTSTGQWDVDVLFPDSVPIAVALAAIRSAGMEFVPFDNETLAHKPWVTIHLTKPEKSGGGKGNRLPDCLKPTKTSGKSEAASAGRDAKLVGKAKRLLGTACGTTRCSIVDIDEELLNEAHSWETWIRGLIVSFPSNADLDAFSRFASSGRWSVTEAHRKPAEYAVTIIVDERPTDQSLEHTRSRIEGASSVKLGHLRLGPDGPL